MSYLASLVSESVGRREGNLEVTVRLEGKVGNEGPEERMGSPHTEKPDCVGMIESRGREWVTSCNSSM